MGAVIINPSGLITPEHALPSATSPLIEFRAPTFPGYNIAELDGEAKVFRWIGERVGKDGFVGSFRTPPNRPSAFLECLGVNSPPTKGFNDGDSLVFFFHGDFSARAPLPCRGFW